MGAVRARAAAISRAIAIAYAGSAVLEPPCSMRRVRAICVLCATAGRCRMRACAFIVRGVHPMGALLSGSIIIARTIRTSGGVTICGGIAIR